MDVDVVSGSEKLIEPVAKIELRYRYEVQRGGTADVIASHEL